MQPRFPSTLATLLLALSAAAAACAGAARPRFPLRTPLARDTDLNLVRAPCRTEPTKTDPHHVACAPEVYESSFAGDGMDQLIFRPLSHTFAVAPGGEAPNVTAFDEVLDSAWFENRLGVRALGLDEVALGGCKPEQLLDPESSAEGSWVIDKGKEEGSSPGFRIQVPGKGKYMLKLDDSGEGPRDGETFPGGEVSTAAAVIGAAAYHAVGFNTSCEQVVFVRRSVLKLTPGLTMRGNSGVLKKFDQAALDAMFAKDTVVSGRLRFSASAWLPGRTLGPFRYDGTRSDDPNDVIPHEDRRELRGAKLVAEWVGHVDSREQNTMDSWLVPQGRPEDSSPGFVRHYYLDTSDCLGSGWPIDAIARRLGYTYVFDWGDIGLDLVTLGAVSHPWDVMEKVPGHRKFGYFDAQHFEPDEWKNEYPNAPFGRMTERDAAWMARILARWTPAMTRELAALGRFAQVSDADYIAGVLDARLTKILQRYLHRVSPVADLRVEGGDRLCGTDLAEARVLADPARFVYAATMSPGRAIEVVRAGGGALCVRLPHVAPDGGVADDAEGRYVTVTLTDGFASGPLVAHLYDLGPTRGYRLAGIERPEP